MATILRRGWGRGWLSDADPTNGPLDGLLRADNCVLDDLGALTQRQGSALVSTLAESDISSLYTAVLGGTRYRLTAAGNSVYNGTSAIGAVTGTGDVSFGAMGGQVFWARGTTAAKFDGSTVRTWGIGMTGGAPTVAAIAPDVKTFISFDASEAATCEEGEDSPDTGQDGTGNGAMAVIPDEDTGRVTVTRDYGSETNFALYNSGLAGCDDDLIQCYVYVTEPQSFKTLTLMFDVNGSAANLFAEDYYSYRFQAGDELDLSAMSLADSKEAEGAERRRLTRIERERDTGKGRESPVSGWRDDRPDSATTGWNKIAVRRGMFKRHGSTTGKGWDTVRAARIVVQMKGGGEDATVKFDQLEIQGGAQRPLTGVYAYRYVYVRNAEGYTAKSPVSDASADIRFETAAATVTVPADGSRDGQVNEIWIFRFGGLLDAYYRVAVQTGVSGGGSYAVQDTLSDRDALIVNIRLETDNATPPANIVGIEGPYYDRLWALTATTLWPSRVLDPDAFSAGQAITVGDDAETAYWVRMALGGLYVGTSRDIYRIDGTAAELPDETIDVRKTPLNIDHPPISAAVAQDGDLLIYLAADGWRAIAGSGSQRVPGQPVALWRGESRHGVSAVNVAGRFRATLSKGQFVAVTPEGADYTGSATLHRALTGTGLWYRHTYPVTWQAIHREPDGTLLAGTSQGTVYQLDTGTTDAGTLIPVTVWTVQDDGGSPYTRKDPRDARLTLDTGGSTLSAAVHLDASATAGLTVSATQTGVGTTVADLSALAAWTRLQWRFSGSVAAFRLIAWEVQYLDLPHPVRGLLASSNAGYAGEKTIAGITLRCNTRSAAVVVTPYYDQVAGTPFTVTSTDSTDPETHIEQFTSTVTATDFALHFGGDVELYEWAPIELFRHPLPVRIWDSGPLDLGVPDLTWIRAIRLKVKAGGDLTITPYFDGVKQAAVTAHVETLNVPTVLEASCGRGYKGKTPQIVITSTAGFRPYWIELLRRGTTAQTDRKPIRFSAGIGGTTKA